MSTLTVMVCKIIAPVSLCFLVTAVALAENMYIKRWQPALTIDQSQLIVIVEPMSPPRLEAVALVPGSPIGRVMELRVISVLDGANPGKTIPVFQVAGGIHEAQQLTDDRFVLFLRQLNADERALVKKLPPAEYPEIRRKFSELTDADPIWGLSSPVDQWMSYYPLVPKAAPYAAFSFLQIQLEPLGIGTRRDAIEYFKHLIQIRRTPAGQRVVPADADDPFVSSVLSK